MPETAALVGLLKQLENEGAKILAQEAPVGMKRTLGRMLRKATWCPVANRIAEELSRKRMVGFRTARRLGCFAVTQVCRRTGFHIEHLKGLCVYLGKETAEEVQREVRDVLAGYQLMARELCKEGVGGKRFLLDGFVRTANEATDCRLVNTILEKMEACIKDVAQFVALPSASNGRVSPDVALRKLQCGTTVVALKLDRAQAAIEDLRERALQKVAKPVRACGYDTAS